MVMIEIENIKKFMAGFLGGNLFDERRKTVHEHFV